MKTHILFLSMSLITVGCTSPPPDVAAGCNPLVGDDCLTPFPSNVFLGADGKVSIAKSALPVQSNGIAIDPTRMNARDGFSPATPFIVYFKAGVDGAQLPTPDHPKASLTPTATVQVMDLAGNRVPAMAELDVNVGPGDRQALLIRPLVRLDADARYVVALVGLHDTAGKPLVAKGFAALRDKSALNHSLQALEESYEHDVFPALQKAGVARKSVTLAWEVKTSSDASSHLLAMRDTAYGMDLGYAITSSTENTDAHVLREILATVQTPNFLADKSGKSNLAFDASGMPRMNGTVDTPIAIHIPSCAAQATDPLPVIVFGHGIFGTALDTLRIAKLETLADEFCAVFVGTDWIGLAKDDEGTVADVVASDLNRISVVTDRLQQAHVNAQAMTRVFLTKMLSDPALQVNGRPVSDGKQVYYIGVSLGGIQGGTFMGISPDVTRGVLNVPGGEWSTLIFRSLVFNALQPLLQSGLPDPLDQQVAIAATQGEWDYTDPITFAPHLTGKREMPLAAPASTGMAHIPAKLILVQESEGDALVSNLATRTLARTIGLSGFDLTTPVYGIPVATPPLASAYTQWNSHPMPLPPPGDTALAQDNGAHTAVAQNHVAQQQMEAFLRMGQAVSVCNGVCNIQ